MTDILWFLTCRDKEIYWVAIYHSFWQSDKILMHFMGDSEIPLYWLCREACQASLLQSSPFDLLPVFSLFREG